MTGSVESEHAVFTRPSRDLLEVRLKPGLRIDVALIAGIMRERKRLCGTERLCILALATQDTEVDFAVMGMDHYAVNASADGVQAVAIVTNTLLLETMARLYAAYFPPVFRLAVFDREDEARAWVGEQLAQYQPTGRNS